MINGNLELLWDHDNNGSTALSRVASGDPTTDVLEYTATASGGTYYIKVYSPNSSNTNENYILNVEWSI
jgi:hypothetical protein